MKQNYLACGRYLLLEKLGKGGFGLIYSGLDLKTGNRVAIKLEDTTRARKKYLKLEYKIYKRYHSDWFHLPFAGQAFIPEIYTYAQDGGFRVLVMELLGPSLSELFSYQYDRFSLKTVAMLAIKAISAIELLHSKGILHRDIKPGNFVMGRGVHGNDIYLIDYGLASPYIDSQGHHIPFSTHARFHGTDKYASINNHKKIEPSRRDDLESLGYVLLYFISGNLPWSEKYGHVTKQQRRSIYGKMKMDISIKGLTKSHPKVFRKYFENVESLGFSEKPDYNKLRRLWLDALSEHGHVFDNIFDWTITKDSDIDDSSSCEL
jgi:serine/threonine protein kinase